MFEARVQATDHPLHTEAADMAREYIKNHQAEMKTRGQEKSPLQQKRAG